MDALIEGFTALPGYLLDHPILLALGGLMLGASVVLALRTPKEQ